MCNETLVILILVALLMAIIYMMYMRRLRISESFEDSTIQSLLAQYQALTDEEKEKLAQEIGLPLSGNDDMIHKSAIPPQRECPSSKFNEMDYVKRSSIPPCPEPKACVAPKVVVDADLCKKQECPPCPSLPDVARVETKQVPVFITKTVIVDEDGNEIKTVVEQSDIELGDEFLVTGSSSETMVDEPETTSEEPDSSSTIDDLINFLFD
jgi:hypothetical protein